LATLWSRIAETIRLQGLGSEQCLDLHDQLARELVRRKARGGRQLLTGRHRRDTGALVEEGGRRIGRRGGQGGVVRPADQRRGKPAARASTPRRVAANIASGDIALNGNPLQNPWAPLNLTG
jgi:hypothetical protein